MRHRLLAIAGTLLLVASCAEEMPEKITPTPGEDVSFSANLNGNQTRTLYGAEEGNSVKVNWVDGDLINVYGTTCTQGRQLAEYKVNTAGAKDQNYATSLDKTGDAGVQWGEAETSDFYAVYPSTATIAANGDNGVNVSASIRKAQKNIFKFEDGTWKGVAYDTDRNNPSMPDAVMYACTSDVKNGATVDLKFRPITTVLKFELKGFAPENDLANPTLTVQSITLTAPEGVKIAGNFDLNINRDGSIVSTAANNASNSITIETYQEGGSYMQVQKNQPMEFNVFVIPQTEEEVAINSDWSITVQTQDQTFVVKKYKYNLVQKATSDKKNTLTAGLIHKLSIPKATIPVPTTTFDPSKWMEQIPRNVYLSELSVPGAWYCTNQDYQLHNSDEDPDLLSQYNAGIRAFNIDCRLTYTKAKYISWVITNPDTSSDLELVCAGNDKYSAPTLGTGTGTLSATKVIDKLIELSKRMDNHKGEYIIAVLTIAEAPKTSAKPGGTAILGTVDPSLVLSRLASEISSHISELGNLYTKKIDSNTTVNDVLGHMILKINVNTTDDIFLGYNEIPNTLLSLASMAKDKTYGENIEPGVFNKMQHSEMYFGKTTTGLTYYYHQAQLTEGEGALFTERKAAIDEIIAQSSKIYQNSEHNCWYQIGIGGYTKENSENRIAVAQELNPYLLEKINNKIETDPSPVGIVLMNFCTDDATTGTSGKGKALVDAIIKMNAKFRLDRDTNAPEWYDDDTQSTVQSAKEGYSSGFNVDTDNWEAFRR